MADPVDYKLLLSYLLVLFVVLLSYKEKLGAEWHTLESSIRTTVQLLLIGHFLNFLLHIKGGFTTWMVLASMSVFGSFIASERLGLNVGFLRKFLIASVALNVSAGFVFLVVYLLGVVKHESIQTISLWGLVLGNSLSNVALAVERLKAETQLRRWEIEAMVALGAPLKLALKESMKKALHAAMLPKYNMLKSAGVVHIPGVGVGMILAGADPVSAMLYQVVVMYILLSVGFLTSFLVLNLSYRYVTL
ncbi:ABC transporter permease [Thermocrinis minervae]|uniref:Putative ABC transport system permease protein n=1 Tax=Thermocrinis minervae TaxID=381751 RepID=A0A1M6TGR7_9AQUI|nr:ABC transporter permease [Thermocrinis minervae]SHK56150.1 putative ABC transport system permease protein [Thermocrinis minervae]